MPNPENYIRLVRDLAEQLPPGCANLSLTPHPNEDLILVADLIPSNHLAAPIGIVVDSSGNTYLTFGQASRFEIIAWPRASSEQLEEIRTLCAAVIDGRFSEVVYRIGGHIVGARGTLELPEGPVRSTSWRGMLAPFRKKRKELINYSSFREQPETR